MTQKKPKKSPKAETPQRKRNDGLKRTPTPWLIAFLAVFSLAGLYFIWVADQGRDAFLEAANGIRSWQDLGGWAGLYQGVALAGVLAGFALAGAISAWLAKASWDEIRLRLKV
jgi:hypothetical protein